MPHFVIIEHHSRLGPQRFFDMPLPQHGEPDWYKNTRSWEAFKKREQKRTTSNVAWRKSIEGGIWYYCAWNDDYQSTQSFHEKWMSEKEKPFVFKELPPNQIYVYNVIVERINCKSMAEFYAHVGWDHPNKKFTPESKVMSWK